MKITRLTDAPYVQRWVEQHHASADADLNVTAPGDGRRCPVGRSANSGGRLSLRSWDARVSLQQGSGTPELIEPTVRLYSAWREAHEEWGGAHEDGFGCCPLTTSTPLSDSRPGWRGRPGSQTRRAPWAPAGSTPPTGGSSRTTRYSARSRCATNSPSRCYAPAGHVGYGVRLSAHGRGLTC